MTAWCKISLVDTLSVCVCVCVCVCAHNIKDFLLSVILHSQVAGSADHIQQLKGFRGGKRKALVAQLCIYLSR